MQTPLSQNALLSGGEVWYWYSWAEQVGRLLPLWRGVLGGLLLPQDVERSTGTGGWHPGPPSCGSQTRVCVAAALWGMHLVVRSLITQKGLQSPLQLSC